MSPTLSPILVAPRTGAWIETAIKGLSFLRFWSPLVQGRGLKQQMGGRDATPSVVAPRTGAWIETGRGFYKLRPCYVAPRTGAWIETRDVGHTLGALAVAPRTGAWIETESC